MLPTLDVILTQTSTAETPKQADFLAQANNQRGGGEHDKAERPREPVSSPVPKPQPGVAPTPLRAQAPTPQPRQPTPVVATRAVAAQRGRPQPGRAPRCRRCTCRPAAS